MEEDLKKHQDEIIVFAETNFRNDQHRFGIKTDDRRRHMYLVGKTGMGKSVALENMIFADIQAGHGLAVVDPHGDLAEKVLDFIPKNRVNDVIYFNPADIDYPIAFNILEKVDPHYRHLVASGLIGVFKKIWADSWGPRLEYVLRNAILALLDYPDSTLLGINRMFIDKDYRKKVIAKIQDPVVKSFWAEEFAKYGPQFAVEAVAPIQNKVGQFLSTSLIRNVVGQVKSTIDVRKIMDEGKILIMNLAKGRIGEDASGLMGAMMITKIQLAAMSRVDIPESQRKDFYLYVDEFQNFATESFANILSEARKYRLNLILAHQYIEQLNEVVRPAVFGNVGTIICYRVGAADAEELEIEFTPRFTQEDLVNLPKYNVYMKLMIDGIASDPFSARTLPPISKNFDNRDKIIAVSRERYAKPKNTVEDKIRRWSGVEAPKEEKEVKEETKIPEKIIASKKSTNFLELLAEPQSERQIKEDETKSPAKKSEEPLFEVSCDNCGELTKIKFKPDDVRAIYCKECLKKSRRGLLPTVKKKPEPIAVANRPEEPKAISLDEALKQKPVPFRQSKIRPPEIKAPSVARSEIKPPVVPNREPVVRNQTARSEEKSNPIIKSSSERSVKPGQVIKLNSN